MLEFWLCAIALIITVTNVINMRVVGLKGAATVSESVDVLIPMRDEEDNVEGSLKSALNSELLESSSVYALDDNSTDQTGKLISEFKVNKLIGAELPAGWLGKIWACHNLSQAGTGNYLVFLDADVRLHPYAIASAITKMNNFGWDFISPYPRQIAGSFLEKLIQPLLQWSWLASVPLRLAEKFPNRSMTIANGQFFVVKRSAYEEAGGHAAIPGEVLDDLELARLLVSKGFKGGVADGSAVASCRMYKTNSQLIDGYTKSLWKAFGGQFGTVVAILLLFFTGISPYLGIGAPATFILLSRFLAAIKTRSNPAYAFLHPISIAILIYLIVLSSMRKSRGTLIWRGRTIS
jgi:cellulose synthase/poly-beta-1,6-N-acetylglucosamine synthase-like glycosyltransferase